jgi:hypothetical protein
MASFPTPAGRRAQGFGSRRDGYQNALGDVLEATNSALKRIYGIIMQVAEFDAYMLDGKKDSGIFH